MLPLASSPWTGAGSGGFDGEAPDFEATLTAEASLHDHLVAQLDLATRDPVERLVGRHLIDAIDEAGYLAESVDAVAERLGAEPARRRARPRPRPDVRPAGRRRSHASPSASPSSSRSATASIPPCRRWSAISTSWRGAIFAALRRLCGVDDEDLAEMLAEAAPTRSEARPRFRRRPGRGPDPRRIRAGRARRQLARSSSTRTRCPAFSSTRPTTRACREPRKNEADKTFLADCLQTANWLARSLDQRAKTILKVATEIVRQQDGFFAHGVAHLRPLNLKTVADAIGMHESTVSRVTSNKSIGTSRGTFEMKYFFTAAIPGAAGAEAHSSEAVRHRIKQLIEARARRRRPLGRRAGAEAQERRRRHRPAHGREVPGIPAHPLVHRASPREAGRRPAHDPGGPGHALPQPSSNHDRAAPSGDIRGERVQPCAAGVSRA